MKNDKRKIERLIDKKSPDLIKKQKRKSKNRTQFLTRESILKKSCRV